MSGDLCAKLGIRTGSKVCLIRPNPATLAGLKKCAGQAELIADGVGDDCDVILYWYDPEEDVYQTMLKLQDRIKTDGRIWVIIPKKEVAKKRHLAIDWNEMQKAILKTPLVDNKIASINDEEYGTQFVVRREFR